MLRLTSMWVSGSGSGKQQDIAKGRSVLRHWARVRRGSWVIMLRQQVPCSLGYLLWLSEQHHRQLANATVNANPHTGRTGPRSRGGHSADSAAEPAELVARRLPG